MSLLSFFTGPDFRKLYAEGAIIIDVRSVHEYDNGRIPDSFNISQERLPASLERIKHYKKPVIICGTDSSRINNAIRYLKNNGVKNVYNGGHWEKLLQKIRS